MELFSAEFLTALAAIIVIDLVLAGDNALVIGLAARNVPKAMQNRVIVWGTVGAIVVRVVLTLLVVWLLKVPGFLLAGGVALAWIAWRLTQEAGDAGHDVKPATTLRGAIQTIVVADAVMGVDNVLAVGGAAHGSLLLVGLGLAISIPIVVWGSRLILKAVERFPSIIVVGAGVLGWTAAKMIANEPLLAPALAHDHVLRVLLYVVLVGAVIAAPLWRRLHHDRRAEAAVVVFVIAWLAVFDWLEVRLDLDMHPLEEWAWHYELLDLAMYAGWIPFAVLLHRVVVRRGAGPAQGDA